MMIDIIKPQSERSLGFKLAVFFGVTVLMYIFSSVFAVVMQKLLPLDSLNMTRMVQLIVSVGVFVMVPVLSAAIFTSSDKPFYAYLGQNIKVGFLPLFCAMLSMMACIPFINWFADINEMIFPADANSKHIEELTIQLLTTDSVAILIANIIVLALIPAIGEELFFRGFLQTTLIKHKLNPHVAILITGFVFSAFHFQLNALLPRWILGVFLGYLLWTSRSIWLSTFAHFVNNVMIVIYSFFVPAKLVGDSYLDNVGKDAPLLAIVSLLIFALLAILTCRFAGNEKKMPTENAVDDKQNL